MRTRINSSFSLALAKSRAEERFGNKFSVAVGLGVVSSRRLFLTDVINELERKCSFVGVSSCAVLYERSLKNDEFMSEKCCSGNLES